MKKIPLTQGKYAIVDAEDYEILMQWKWKACFCTTTKSYYAIMCNGDKKHVRMHRVIMNVSNKNEVDHISHDTLDNRKDNLREVSHHENMKNKKLYKTNKSGVAGIYWHKKDKRWRAAINVNGKKIHIGSFKDIEAAKFARLEAQKEFGYHENHGINLT